MPHVVRSRARALPGTQPPTPTPPTVPAVSARAVLPGARGGPAEPPLRSPVRPLPAVDEKALAVLHRAARALREELPELTDRLVDALRDREPAYRAAIDADRADIRQEALRSLGHGLDSLLHPREARDAARRCSRRIGATRAGQGLPLDALLHAFRLGGSMVWQGLVDRTAHHHPHDVHLLVHVAADVWNFVDEHCALVADGYRQVERRLARRHEDRLRLMTAALLDGTTRIADLPEVAAALDLPERGRYLVVLVSGGDRAAYAGARRPRGPAGTRAVWHTGAGTERGIVLIGDSGPADVARRMTGPPGARIGIGSAVEGLAAVGEARRLAETALGICPDSGGTVLLDDHLPAALVVRAPALGTALAERALGPLLRLDGTDRDLLLDTLAAWLDCDGSAQRAGARLYCHRNTVLNRLRRCEQLTGRSLTRPRDVVEISLALTALRHLDVP
ncbi:PucR family transcriptional regulator [Streptomyces sp. SP18CS02]|uniref:PucR family transcriptional regulator n=1 Tax=Streptomyces sp. SP18CS02 TaxID=3002531 RepID=UPI002E7750A7|nr:helix-turn-helix domain-containing protein [Streptomyces sp. SP18CS02]MEE1754574.1 helix-turn-helix domain-containing protein [Streptomyces sp. SP18CS02]